jgi:hypothetical protein
MSDPQQIPQTSRNRPSRPKQKAVSSRKDGSLVRPQTDHTVSPKSLCPPDVATRQRIMWRQHWAKLATRTDSQTHALMAKSVFAAIRAEIGEAESIAWPGVLLEESELTRDELYRALGDLADDGLIGLDANEHGVFVDTHVRESEEDEFLSYYDESAVAV